MMMQLMACWKEEEEEESNSVESWRMVQVIYDHKMLLCLVQMMNRHDAHHHHWA